ncbi:site-specific integrase [Saccharothrix sp.]|uniref:tyrosine-type recombinase/integrase n=1 Tax=Saccharothrix sp. TaxID=1873460 RepID=UPI0028123235|nr:site-specific integrase [Saccharothrix sp.]
MATAKADPADVEMALQFLARMGVEPQDLVDRAAREVVPTFAEVIPRVREAIPTASLLVYAPYFTRIEGRWGERRCDEPAAAEVHELFEWVRANAKRRRSSNGGQGAVLHTYEALRCIYRYLVDEQILTPRQNLMNQVTKPRKGRSRRHAISPGLWREIFRAAATTGEDPALDALLLRFHLETAARRGGALALRLGGLDPEQCLVLLEEKGSTTRWQPVSPTMMRHLLAHAHDRGAREPDARVFRFLDGRPITRRRYENLWVRIGRHVESVRTLGISTHWLRHTTLTWVERIFGVSVARAYAGHADPSSNRQGTTFVYTKATMAEIATAVQTLTGEPHPLADQPLEPAGASPHPLRAAGRPVTG